MSDPVTNQDLHAEISRLSERLNVIAQPYENALAERLYSAAREKLFGYVKLFLFILVPALGYFGIRTFRDVAEGAQKTVEKEVANKVAKAVEVKVDKEMRMAIDARIAKFDTELDSKLDVASERSTIKLDNRFATYDARLSSLSSVVRNVNDNVAKAGGPSAPVDLRELKLPPIAALGAPEAPPVTAYAYFGLQKPDGSWSDLSFVLLQPGAKGEPVPGLKAKVRSSTNARTGRIEYSGSTYKLAPSLGVLEEEAIVTISEVYPTNRPPAGVQYWIKFKDLPATALRRTTSPPASAE